MSKAKVYYNSACPVCDAGVAYQRQRLGDDSEVEWIDVHENNAAARDVCAELEHVRERLHVVDESGAVHVGAEAFAELWQRDDKQLRWARLVRAPGVSTLARFSYNGFARLLYIWNRLHRRW